ncbi:MAG: tryptophan--tRNA ligase [Bacilli bacterium]|nr:tryptophan--tRNA ligase [Bacilli bacterium]
MERLLSGIKPTGELTLGNYIGSIRQFIEMQKNYESFIFVADLHAITVHNDPEILKERIKKLVALYLACGLDPKENTIFLQSENLYHTALSWVLECNSYIGELNRMTQFKDKSQGKNNESIGCGLYTYPVLMASDIIIYDADVVPTGIDQKQHVELARNIAERFNHKYGETFKIPKPVIPKVGEKIKDLQNPTKKMSKTEENPKGYILLLEEPEIARKKIMSAVTDSEAIVKYDEINKPGISNLMTIYSTLTNKSFAEIEKEFSGCNYGTFKTRVADVVVELLTNIQTKYNEIINSNLVDEVLNNGINKVLPIAEAKVKEVYKKIGLGR